MRRFWHLLAADLRQFRWALVLWLVVLAAKALVEGGRPLVAADPALRESVAVLDSVLWLTQVLTGFALVSFIVHAHPTVGTDAFWMTRPIAPRLLLGSKLLLTTAVLVVAPVIADTALLATYGVPGGIAAGVLAQSIEFRVVLAALLTVGAALTRNFARFALLCGSALLALAIAIATVIAVVMARAAETSFGEGVGFEAGPTGPFVFNVLLVAGALVLLMVQYQTRRRDRSAAVGLAVVAAAYAASSMWPLPFLAPVLQLPAGAEEQTVIALDSASVTTNTVEAFFPGSETRWNTVNGDLKTSKLPVGWSATVAVRSASIHLSGGEPLRSEQGPRYALRLAGGEPVSSAALRELLDVDHLASPDAGMPAPRPVDYPVLFVIRQEELARHVPARGEYRANLDVHLTQHIVDGVLPLRAGGLHRRGGYRFVIDSVSRRNDEVAIGGRESRAASVWERRPLSSYSFYLRNRARREALSLNDFELRGHFTFARFIPFVDSGVGTSGTGFRTRGVSLTRWHRYGADRTTVAPDDGWLADAELVIVRTTQEGSLQRTLHLPDFALDTPGPRAGFEPGPVR